MIIVDDPHVPGDMVDSLLLWTRSRTEPGPTAILSGTCGDTLAVLPLIRVNHRDRLAAKGTITRSGTIADAVLVGRNSSRRIYVHEFDFSSRIVIIGQHVDITFHLERSIIESLFEKKLGFFEKIEEVRDYGPKKTRMTWLEELGSWYYAKKKIGLWSCNSLTRVGWCSRTATHHCEKGWSCAEHRCADCVKIHDYDLKDAPMRLLEKAFVEIENRLAALPSNHKGRSTQKWLGRWMKSIDAEMTRRRLPVTR